MMNMQSICVDKIGPSELVSWWWLVYLLNSLSTSINWLHCYWVKALLVMAWIWQSVACAPPGPACPAPASLLHADTMDWLNERRQSNRWLWAGALMYHLTKICQGFSLMQNRAKSNWQELNISLLHTPPEKVGPHDSSCHSPRLDLQLYLPLWQSGVLEEEWHSPADLTSIPNKL